MSSVNEVLRALNEGVLVPDVLRLCLQLPEETTAPEFDSFVRHELNGYPQNDALPEYREIPTMSFGNATNGVIVQSEYPISSLLLPDDLTRFRDSLVWVREPVGSVISMISQLEKAEPGAQLGTPWIPEALALLNHAVSQGRTNAPQSYRFLSAHKVVSAGAYVAIVEGVRTRIVEELGPLATGGADPQESDGSAASLTVSGGNNQILVNSTAHLMIQNVESWHDLRNSLRELGVSDGALTELHEILNHSPGDPSTIQRALEWAKGQAASLPAQVASGTIATLLLQHLHLL